MSDTLFIMHVDSLASYESEYGKLDARAFRDGLIFEIEQSKGRVVIVHQGWGTGYANTVIKASDPARTTVVEFDEDTTPWANFEQQVATLVSPGDDIELCGLWWEGKQASSGCASRAYQILVSLGCRVTPNYDLLGQLSESNDGGG